MVASPRSEPAEPAANYLFFVSHQSEFSNALKGSRHFGRTSENSIRFRHRAGFDSDATNQDFQPKFSFAFNVDI